MSTAGLIDVHAQRFPLKSSFGIARGAKTVAEVVVATVGDDAHQGRGECVPYARYGESVADTLATIRAWGRAPCSRARLQDCLPAGAARNAIDCALWDLEAARSGRPVWQLAGLQRPRACVTAYTLPIESPADMAASARRHRQHSLLKVKLGGSDSQRDGERLRAIRAAVPDARLIVDANEGWDLARLRQVADIAAEVGVEMIEQPLPAHDDALLADLDLPVALGADESVHAQLDLDALAARYQVLNLKLDKTGGLTAALTLAARARTAGFDLMIGCMVSTSLSMAPALLLAANARYVDLDGPLLLRTDRPGGLVYDGDRVALPPRPLWGSGAPRP